MKICSKCGAPIADFEKFCQECGAPAPVYTDPTQEERLYGKIPKDKTQIQTETNAGGRDGKPPKKPLSLKPSKSFVKGLVFGLAIMVAAFIAMLHMNAIPFGMAKTAIPKISFFNNFISQWFGHTGILLCAINIYRNNA